MYGMHGLSLTSSIQICLECYTSLENLRLHPAPHRTETRIIETEYGTQLLIQLPPRPVGRSRMKELFYSEPVKHLGQYESVCIYSGTALLARFTQIETLV